MTDDVCSNCGHEYGEHCETCGFEFGCGRISRPCKRPECPERVIPGIDEFEALLEERLAKRANPS